MADDEFWVVAVGKRFGWYNAARHYPKGYPNPRQEHPRAGRPFKLNKAEDFSDCDRKGPNKNGITIPPGWMKRVSVQVDPVSGKLVAVPYQKSAPAPTLEAVGASQAVEKPEPKKGRKSKDVI